MSATDAVSEAMRGVKPEKGQTIQDLAEFMYSLQMEIYSAWAMTDYDDTFEFLSDENKEGWLDAARKKMEEHGYAT